MTDKVLEYVIFIVICLAVMYPFAGGILYGDPWMWVFKKE